MEIVVNGEAQEVAQGTTLAQLVEQRGLVGKRFAIEVNQEVVPRSQYAQSRLGDRDRIEIVGAIGGG
jgi:sulfur carrier protein